MRQTGLPKLYLNPEYIDVFGTKMIHSYNSNFSLLSINEIDNLPNKIHETHLILDEDRNVISCSLKNWGKPKRIERCLELFLDRNKPFLHQENLNQYWVPVYE